MNNFPKTELPFESPSSTKSPFSFASSKSQNLSQSENIERLSYSKTFSSDNVALKLTGCEIKNPTVTDMFGDLNTGQTPALVVSMNFKNLDKRKILRFQEENIFAGSKFKLRDDAGNTIRGISYGIGTKVNGSLDGREDILPNATANHVEVFMAPPPKTKSVILTIDLDCVDREGVVEFEIPASAFFK